MARLNELSRDYEARHFPPTRRLDLQAEGPRSAPQRALRWIQTWAHEEPGAELLLVLERGSGGRSGVRAAVEAMLDRQEGGLIDWWQPFTSGTVALRIAEDPRMVRRKVVESAPEPDEGRTEETSGPAYVAPERDIPADLLPQAERLAEMRRAREGLSPALMEVVLRRVWIDAQAEAMTAEIGWAEALARLVRRETARGHEVDES